MLEYNFYTNLLITFSITHKYLKWLCDIIPKKYNPILQWIKNYSKKFLPLKGRWIQKRQFLKTEGFPRPFAFVTRRIEYKHLWCAKIYLLWIYVLPLFVYIGFNWRLYKRIVNADTQSIRIANADGQGGQVDVISLLLYFDMLVCQTPSPFGYSLLSKRESCFLFFVNGLYKLLLLDKRRWPSGRRSLKVLLVYSFELPA